jgi:segregation and condensation protein B
MVDDNEVPFSARAKRLSDICEALIFASEKPLSVERLRGLIIGDDFSEEYSSLTNAELKNVLTSLTAQYEGRGVRLLEVAGGYRFQTSEDCGVIVNRLWDEKPQRYSRALLETLALVAYRQPITRGDIEEIRGVSVSSHIVKTLVERDWIRVVGHRDVPGRPSIYATTKQFLDYFGLKSLEQLPALADIRDLDVIGREVSRQLDLVSEESGRDREEGALAKAEPLESEFSVESSQILNEEVGSDEMGEKQS